MLFDPKLCSVTVPADVMVVMLLGCRACLYRILATITRPNIPLSIHTPEYYYFAQTELSE